VSKIKYHTPYEESEENPLIEDGLIEESDKIFITFFEWFHDFIHIIFYFGDVVYGSKVCKIAPYRKDKKEEWKYHTDEEWIFQIDIFVWKVWNINIEKSKYEYEKWNPDHGKSKYPWAFDDHDFFRSFRLESTNSFGFTIDIEWLENGRVYFMEGDHTRRITNLWTCYNLHL
jgi:hypothetical protein